MTPVQLQQAQVQAGARVRVTGICTLIRRDEERRLGRPAGNFSLLVTGNEGFEVVDPAS